MPIHDPQTHLALHASRRPAAPQRVPVAVARRERPGARRLRILAARLTFAG
jgi:hypothetical protein